MDVVGQLGGYALGEVLSSLELDQETIQNAKRGLGVEAAAFSRDSIYNGKFVDEDEEPYDPVTDLEAQVDREMINEQFTQNHSTAATLLRGEEDDFDDDDEDDHAAPTIKQEEEPAKYRFESVEPIAPLPPIRQVPVKDLFPSFEYNQVLTFTDLFTARPRKKPKILHNQIAFSLPSTDELPRAKSTRDVLLASLRPTVKHSRLRSLLIESTDGTREDWQDEGDSHDQLVKAIQENNSNGKNQWRIPATSNAFEMAELDDWEDRIIWGPSEGQSAQPTLPPTQYLAPRNAEFEAGDWLKSVIWDANKPYKDFSKLNLNLNDTEMLLEVQNPTATVEWKAPAPIQQAAREAGLDPFNLSNDRAYEIAKEAKSSIRQTFGVLEVQHAYPAQKLQLPLYKTRLTKADARAFHRPPIQFPTNIQFNFTKVRSSKKKKDKKTGRKIKKLDGDSIRTTSDLSLRDTSNYVLCEYSEENPPIISNIGMGSIIVNYYRKTDTKDEFIPKLDIGEPVLLDPTDDSPFKAFGSVLPGQTCPTLYNNLVRAPLFRQKPYDTDFLIVRSTISGESKYYIREIKTNFVIGQTYPIVEVPGPHSRKVTALIKQRLQSIVFKLVARNSGRIKVQKLLKYFPDQTDLQMRQRLKEFMEFNRREPNLGYWTVKKHIVVPDENELLKLSTPEMVCLAESMQVGLRHLQDAGYGKTAEEGGAGDDDSKLDIEQQLAPWITTKNFINATANKAMLKLFGEGDPTGRGEAFSFLRVSMKDIFLRDGEEMATRLAQMESRPKSAHRYNVQEQQDVYKEEIARIWKAQKDALSSPIEPQLTQDDEDRQRGRKPSANRAASTIGETPRSMVGTPAGRAGSVNSDDDNVSVASGPAGGQTKILRIKRLVKGQWLTEIVRDPSVIGAYVRQRQMIDEERIDADQLMPSDDAGKNEVRKKRLKEQLEKLKRNQERRLHRKNAKLGIPVGAMGVGGKRASKTETTRVCSNCGIQGHMKTSKKLCKRFAEFNAPRPDGPSSALPTAFGAGLALPIIAAPVVVAPVVPKSTLKIKMPSAAPPPPPPPPAPVPDFSAPWQ